MGREVLSVRLVTDSEDRFDSLLLQVGFICLYCDHFQLVYFYLISFKFEKHAGHRDEEHGGDDYC